jgi:hypothetical protein
MRGVFFLEAPSGHAPGALTNFTLAVGDRPVDPNLLIVIHTGEMYQRVITSPAAKQFTYEPSTGVVHFSTIPPSGAPLQAFIQYDVTKSMRNVSPTANADGSTTVFDFPAAVESPSFPIFIVGYTFPLRASGTPGAGAVSFVNTGPSSCQVTFGTAPPAGLRINGYFQESLTSGTVGMILLDVNAYASSLRMFSALGIPYDPLYTWDIMGEINGRAMTRNATVIAGSLIYGDQDRIVIFPEDQSTVGPMLFAVRRYVRTDIDLTFVTWESDERQQRMLRVTATGKKLPSSSKNFIFATSRDPVLNDGMTQALPFLAEVPSLKKIVQDTGSGASSVTFGALRIQNTYEESLKTWRLDADFGVQGYSFTGHPVTITYGGPTLDHSHWATVFNGIGGEVTRSVNDVTLAIASNEKTLLNTNIGLIPISPTDYPNLPSGVTGYRPLPLGKVLNYRPQLISTTAYVYLLSQVNIFAVLAVRDKGVTLTPTTQYTVTVTAVGVLLTLAAKPIGEVTVDMQGAILFGSTYNAKPAPVFEYLVTTYGGFPSYPFDYYAMARLSQEITWEMGLVVTQPQSLREVLQQYVGELPISWTTNNSGLFVVSYLHDPASDNAMLDLSTDKNLIGVPEVRILPPRWQSFNVAYEQLEYVQSGGDIDTSAIPTSVQAYYKTAYRTTSTVSPSGVSTVYPLIPSNVTVQSRIQNATDAGIARTSLLNLFGVPRTVCTIRVKSLPVAVDVGKTITFQSRRYGIGSPAKWLVIGVERQFGKSSQVQLTLWQ